MIDTRNYEPLSPPPSVEQIAATLSADGLRDLLELKLDEKFGLSGLEMAVLGEAFAYYRHAKSTRPENDHTKEQTDLNRKVSQKLKHSLTAYYDREEGRPGKAMLVNTANYLSTKYLENPRKFKQVVDAYKRHVQKLLGGVYVKPDRADL